MKRRDRASAGTGDRPGAVWSNWAGDRSCTPRDLLRPGSLRELSEVVAEAASAGRQITAAGSGHSFTGAAMSDDLMLDVGALSRGDRGRPFDRAGQGRRRHRTR